MAFEFEIFKTDWLIARMNNLAPEVHSAVVAAVTDQTDQLATAARERIAELFNNPQQMMDAVHNETVDEGDLITGTATASGLPYLAIQEFGGVTSPHDILPVNAQALAFFGSASAQFKPGGMTGPLVIVKAVHHPGSVMPERSYMRAALARRRSAIVAALFAAVATGSKKDAN